MDGTTTMQGTEQEVQNTATETQGQQTAESTPEKVSTLQKFIDGLFGGGKKAEGAEPEKKDGDPVAEKAEEEKSFTQADVDAAIEAAKQQWLDEAAEAERVKKLTPEEKTKEEQEKKDSEIASLRSQLLQKELRESATKSLETDGFPVGLADVLDYSSKERMEETLKNTTKLSKKLDITDFKQGDVTLKVRSLDGIHPLIPVSSDRMKTEYLFKDGVTSGQEAGGFAPTENSKSINWIITPRKAPIAVSKTDKMRIFDPETNQKARAWAMDYRKFHDIWIPARKVEQCFVNVKEELA